MRIEHVALYVKDKYRKKIQSSHSMSFTRLQRTESEIRSGQGNNREKDNDRKREETVDVFCQALFPKKSVRIPCF